MSNVMRKIYESHIVNTVTGEVLKSTTIRSSNYDERFMFARTSEGLEWINDFNTFQDLKLFMYMVEFQEPKSNVIIFTALQIDQCSTFFKCTSKTIKNSISSLINTGFLVRVASHNFVSNPYTFYKGGSKGLIEKIEMWNVLKSK